ncbi:class I SAM-dependent methyltransferase [Elusimicrobiota bacterium]
MNNTSCKLCSKPVNTISDDSIKYYYCSKCGFICKDEGFIVAPDKEKNRYMTHNNAPDNEGYVSMLNEFIDKTVRYAGSGHMHALDYGCGNNPVLAMLLRKRGYTVDTYDKYFAPDKTYRTRKYDIITLTEVIEHIEYPIKTFNELNALINPDGIISIMTLFHPENTEEFKTWWYKRDFTHISFYSGKTLEYVAGTMDMNIAFIDKKNTCVFKKRNSFL